MFTYLWALNIFLAGHALIILAFLGFSWIYFDLFDHDKKSHALIRAIGGIFIAGGFMAGLVINVMSASEIIISSVQVISTTIGVFLVVLGNIFEAIPGMPEFDPKAAENLKRPEPKNPAVSYKQHETLTTEDVGIPKQELEEAPPKKQRLFFHRSPWLIFVAALGLIPVVQVVVVCFQTTRKVRFGMSKQFKPLLAMWIVMAFYFAFEVLHFIGTGNFTWLEVLTRQYTQVWIGAQVLLIVATILMYVWISKFLSFRVFARLFLVMWQSVIGLSVIVASGFSIFLIVAAENQVLELLKKNTQLVQFSFNQVESNNHDLLSVLSQDPIIVSSVENKDRSAIVEKVENFIRGNENLDRVIVTDRSGVLIYDSDKPDVQGESLSGNPVIQATILNKEEDSDYLIEENKASADRLVYQAAFPLVSGEKYVGVISTTKRIDDNYLDLLKEQTQQEVVLYVDGKRSASTIVESDEVSRLENVPFNESELDVKDLDAPDSSGNTRFARVTIVTVPYNAFILSFNSKDQEDIAALIVATEQALLVSTTQRAMFNTFILSVMLSLISTIPIYFLAREVNKEMSA